MSFIFNLQRLLGLGLLLLLVAVNASPLDTAGLIAAGLPYQTDMVYNLTLPSAPSGNASLDFSSTAHHGAQPGTDAAATKPTQLYCNDGTRWVDCDLGRIEQGISYLYGVNAGCWANGRSCSRVSCSYNSAIYLCNDNWGAITVGCNVVADWAQIVVNGCYYSTFRQFQNSGVISGQEFSSDNWNVIIHADSC